ncbi:MAG: response regulator [Deltaproteobacteria bacterium]|nr:response regulator [Deltaproteobacteria bacterium]
MADDDEEDRLLTKEAFKEARLNNELRFVEDGQELLDYLNHHGNYSNINANPLPDLILLDLNMPRMDGREALKEIKADPDLRHIPVVLLTTSKEEEDIIRSYNDGGNSFIVKPVSFSALIEVVIAINKYWFEIVKLPR